MPTRNFQQGSFVAAEKLAPETLTKSHHPTQVSCAGCTIGCEHIYSVRGDGASIPDGVRLEYENLFALGPLCAIDDADTVLQASQRCDQLGLDSISAGGTIAFAMECAERGLIDAPWVRFGRAESLLKAIELIGQCDGLGDPFAEGNRRISRTIGQELISFALEVKGFEIPGYETIERCRQ